MQTTPPVYRYSWLIATLGLLALLAGLVVYVLWPEIWYAAWAILGFGVLLLATAFILDFRQVSRAIVGRRGMFSTGTTVMVSIFIGITILVNAISIGNFHRFDITGVSQFTLTSKTKEVLSELQIPVKALAFFVPSVSTSSDPYYVSAILYSYGTSLLAEYKNYSDKLSVEDRKSVV